MQLSKRHPFQFGPQQIKGETGKLICAILMPFAVIDSSDLILKRPPAEIFETFRLK